MGLSPRVRGNLEALGFDVEGNRSIPARAGEPTLEYNNIAGTGVYPRACGGTAAAALGEYPIAGLSRACGGNPLMSLNVWFVSRRDSFRGYVKDCFRKAVMRRLHVPDRDG